MMAIFLFIVVLLVLIVGHELGHFFAAKAVKMKVLEFGVGFPPRIIGKRFADGGTEYTLNWLPFGGFVRILGEDPKDANEPDAFSRKPALLQAGVLFAGPFANLILAFVLSSIAFMVGVPSIIESLGEDANIRNPRVLIGEVLADSPAFQVGVRAGDQVVALESNGIHRDVKTPEDLITTIAKAGGAIQLTILRNGSERALSIEPVTGLIPDDPTRAAIGVATALIGDISYPPILAILKGFSTTLDDFVFVVVSLASLIGSAFTLSADVSQIAGPVGIASLTGEAARFGFGSLFSFAALLSVNLAVINLFPFPALDGGRLLFLGLEKATRRKIPSSVAGGLNTVGFGLLILLMLAVTVGDITRLFG